MNPAADFLILFAAVSSAALGAAWLGTARVRSLAVREVVWKSAVLLSLALPLAFVATVAPRGAQQESVTVRVRDVRVMAEMGAPRLDARALPAGAKRISPLRWKARAYLPALILALGALNTLWLLWAWGRELSAIGKRRPLEVGPSLRSQLEAPGTRRVRLTAAAGMWVPGVVGLREICIPEEDARRAESDDLVAVVAHEAAHVHRGDLLWLRLLGVAGAFFFFQPLLRVARRELIRIAEFQADEAAVRRTGHRAALVEALLGYAERAHGGVREGTLAFATVDSQLVQRARRILTLDAGRRPSPLLRWMPAAVVLLGSAGAITPLLGQPYLRRIRTEVTTHKVRAGDGAPLVEAVQEVRDGQVHARITKGADGSLITEFRVDGELVPSTPELEEWLRGVLSANGPAVSIDPPL